MNIASTQFTLERYSFEIYVSGCNNPHCNGCYNPELWDFNIGIPFSELKLDIQKKIKRFNYLIHNIMIFGGDLIDQDLNDSIELLDFLNTFDKDIWLFTRHSLSDIHINILNRCNYVKTGRYIEHLSCEKNEWYGINLSTKNQKIYNKEEINQWIKSNLHSQNT